MASKRRAELAGNHVEALPRRVVIGGTLVSPGFGAPAPAVGAGRGGILPGRIA